MPILPTSAEMPASQESCSSTMLCLFPDTTLPHTWGLVDHIPRSGWCSVQDRALRFWGSGHWSHNSVCCLRTGRISMLFDHSRIRGIQSMNMEWQYRPFSHFLNEMKVSWRSAEESESASSRRTCRHTRSVSTTSRLTSCSCGRRCCAILRLQSGSSARNRKIIL